VDEQDRLADQFELHRARLRRVSYRMLGSVHEAEDAVQEAWLRLGRTPTGEVENLGGWLTTVVSRVCLDMLRARRVRPETPIDDIADSVATGDPEEDAVLADSLGAALLVVLDTLSPTQRLVFVLHDIFGVPFEDIAPIVGRTPAATKMLASRARRRIRTSRADPAGEPLEGDQARQHRVVTAFLAASRRGDFAGLVALLHPDAAFEADAVATRAAGFATVRGARAIAEQFTGRARGAQPAWIDGTAGLVWAPGGTARGVFRFVMVDDRIALIELVAEPDRIADLRLEF
jgi:RNA polymerase sigma-70 factor, ECF subfamily